IRAANVFQSGRSEGGLIVTPGALRGIEFGPGGVPRTFTFGSPIGGSYMIGGSGVNQGRYTSLVAPLDRRTAALIATYEFAPAFNVRTELSYGRASSVNEVVQSFSFAPYTILQNNAFLPDSIRQTMIDNGIPSFG